MDRRCSAEARDLGEVIAGGEPLRQDGGFLAADDVGAAVASLVADIGRASPQGLAASKALTTAAILDGFDRDAERLSADSARLFVSDEAREGMLAFLQKRPPRWLPGDGGGTV